MATTKLMIGIPTHKDYCLYKFFINFLKLKKPLNCQTFIYDDQPVSKCRNQIVKRALQWDATHLLFLDDDMTLPENAIEVLLDHDKDIVGLLAFKRREPFLPVIYRAKNNDPCTYETIINYEQGLIPVDATGAACLMIKMDVFRKMRFPWFEFLNDPRNPDVTFGEDQNFCRKAKEAGYQIWVDTITEHQVGHLGIAEVNQTVWDHFKAHKYSSVGLNSVDRLGRVVPIPEKLIIE